MENIQEMLAIPFNVKPVATFDGLFTLYSSKNLKVKFGKMLIKEPLTKPVSNKLSDLILGGKIVPAFVSKGMIKYIVSKLLGSPVSGVAGFYNPKLKQIYILVDTQSNIFGFTSNKILSYTTIHECMHMAADTQPEKFWAIFKNHITDYYNYLFRNCLKIEPGIDFDSSEIRDFLWSQVERGWKSVSNKNIVEFGKILVKHKDKSILTESEFKERIEQIQFIMIASLWKPEVITRMYYKKEYKDLFGFLYKAYKDVFGIKDSYKYTFAYQEYILPSEIICIQTAKINAKNYSAVNII